MILKKFKEESKPLSSNQFKGDPMEEELVVDLGVLTFDVHLDSLVRGTKHVRID